MNALGNQLRSIPAPQPLAIQEMLKFTLAVGPYNISPPMTIMTKCYFKYQI